MARGGSTCRGIQTTEDDVESGGQDVGAVPDHATAQSRPAAGSRTNSATRNRAASSSAPTNATVPGQPPTLYTTPPSPPATDPPR